MPCSLLTPSPPFQSHAGSIEASTTGSQLWLRRLFQSHAGSIEAPFRFGSGGPAAGVFQSHAGSIEAIHLAGPMAKASLVSIPRWFD